MTETERYSAALAFATKKHSGQVRIGGDPYITHPLAVAGIMRDWGYGVYGQITALFHDLLEDTDATEEEILDLGGQRVLTAVKLLTKHRGYVMAEYIAAIKANPLARAVKAADRLHNLRCAQVASNEFKRKYILETVDWYLDFTPEIVPALKSLVMSMDTRLTEEELLYEPVQSWRIQ